MAYPVAIRDIAEVLAAGREIRDSLVVPDVDLGDQSYHFQGPAIFDVTLTNTGMGSFVLSGSAEAEFTTSCVRCLCEFTGTVEADVEGFYVLPGHDAEIPEEQEFEYVSSSMDIDIEPAVRQSVVLDLPFAPVHDAACKGICAQCGADLNEGQCDCATPGPDSRFAALKTLLAPSPEPGDDPADGPSADGPADS
jgi:uncharacterized protein